MLAVAQQSEGGGIMWAVAQQRDGGLYNVGCSTKERGMAV